MGLDFSHEAYNFVGIQFNRILRIMEGYILHLEDIIEDSEERGDIKTCSKALKKIEGLTPLIDTVKGAELSVSQLKNLYPVINYIICDWDNDKVSLAGFAGLIKDAIDSNEPLKFL